MTREPKLDSDFLRGWIGRTESAQDIVSVRLVRELRATLDQGVTEPAAGESAPLAVHWCLAPPAANTSALGPDGHPARGGFLPPVPLPRRMWAGSMLRFEDRLRVGDVVERRSRIADVTVKDGRTGPLCFVAVDHEISTARGLAVSERHDIVYRSPGPKDDTSPTRVPPPVQPVANVWHHDVTATPVLLFRFSALTFNGHRIHYDRIYATEEEGYPGLVVHGPLQATLLLEYAESIRKSAPRSFRMRCLRPLFDFQHFRLCAKPTDSGLPPWREPQRSTCGRSGARYAPTAAVPRSHSVPILPETRAASTNPVATERQTTIVTSRVGSMFARGVPIRRSAV